MENKLGIHLIQDITKSILFNSKCEIKKTNKLNIQYKDIKIKQYSKIIFLGSILDKTLFGELMATSTE